MFIYCDTICTYCQKCSCILMQFQLENSNSKGFNAIFLVSHALHVVLIVVVVVVSMDSRQRAICSFDKELVTKASRFPYFSSGVSGAPIVGSDGKIKIIDLCCQEKRHQRSNATTN